MTETIEEQVKVRPDPPLQIDACNPITSLSLCFQIDDAHLGRDSG